MLCFERLLSGVRELSGVTDVTLCVGRIARTALGCMLFLAASVCALQ